MVNATEFTVCLIKYAIYRNSRYRYFDKGYIAHRCLIVNVKLFCNFYSFLSFVLHAQKS